MIESAFYWSLLFSQFFDVQRKDFWQMFTHHVATLSLLFFSYIVNYVRIGAIVLVIHDCADYWLEVLDRLIEGVYIINYDLYLFKGWEDGAIYTSTESGWDVIHGVRHCVVYNTHMLLSVQVNISYRI